MIKQEYLKQILDYNQETGIFTWLKDNKNQTSKNRIAGYKETKGYIVIEINSKAYKAHRLAWLYVYGHMPNHQIDHINLIKDDNRISNLREVSNAGNQQNNRKPFKNNKLGFLGVSELKKGKYLYYSARIGINNKTLFLGSFKTPEEAQDAYIKAKREIHTTCTI